MTKLRTAALSDIGNLRTHNEDRYLRNEALGLFGVADGIGGLPGGGAECSFSRALGGFYSPRHRRERRGNGP